MADINLKNLDGRELKILPESRNVKEGDIMFFEFSFQHEGESFNASQIDQLALQIVPNPVKKLIREDKYTLKGVKNLFKKRKENPLPIDMIEELKEAKTFLQILLNKMKN